MTTYVHYRYRAPGSSEDVEIRVERWPDKTLRDVLPLINAVGDITEVWSDDLEEHGEGPKKYKVLRCVQGTTQWGYDLRTVTNMVLVIVTDPDPSYRGPPVGGASSSGWKAR
jgi:hypothetical protein